MRWRARLGYSCRFPSRHLLPQSLPSSLPALHGGFGVDATQRLLFVWAHNPGDGGTRTDQPLSTSLILGALWVVASAITAMLPMRHQMVPGIALLIAAPVLLVWIAYVHGWLWLAFGIFAFLSMFRNPLLYFLHRALGRPAPLPKELEK
jgi:hypothetical protein